LDLMYALPKQELDGALADVERAIALGPTHISHYQLTLEPNTVFAANPPPLPDDDHAWAMQEACEARLAEAGYGQHEISAYAQPGRRCAHNLNYWRFRDYLGIGAGAHGKLSDAGSSQIHRRWKTRGPRAYMGEPGGSGRIGGDHVVAPAELPFEYMLNALRLIDGVPMADFPARTGLVPETIAAALAAARDRGWLHGDAQRLQTTALGQRFLNDVIASFLDCRARGDGIAPASSIALANPGKSQVLHGRRTRPATHVGIARHGPVQPGAVAGACPAIDRDRLHPVRGRSPRTRAPLHRRIREAALRAGRPRAPIRRAARVLRQPPTRAAGAERAGAGVHGRTGQGAQ